MLFFCLVHQPFSEYGSIMGAESERHGCHNFKTVNVGVVAIWQPDVSAVLILRQHAFLEYSLYCPTHRNGNDVEQISDFPIGHPDVIASYCDEMVVDSYDVSFHTLAVRWFDK